MPERTIEDRLREEYFDFLPAIRRVAWQLETEIRYHTLTIQHSLNLYEQLVVKSRIKDCESALKSLQRRQEGRVFDPDRPNDYSILDLPDLAGVRVLVFPNSRLLQVDNYIHARFSDWTLDPVNDDSGTALALKYHGYCPVISDRVCGEYQVVPMLLGLFWEVEHAAMYKPATPLKDIASSEQMRNLRTDVERTLRAFEAGFDDFVRKAAFTSHRSIEEQQSSLEDI
jgi:hypothetical protein